MTEAAPDYSSPIESIRNVASSRRQQEAERRRGGVWIRRRTERVSGVWQLWILAISPMLLRFPARVATTSFVFASCGRLLWRLRPRMSSTRRSDARVGCGRYDPLIHCCSRGGLVVESGSPGGACSDGSFGRSDLEFADVLQARRFDRNRGSLHLLRDCAQGSHLSTAEWRCVLLPVPDELWEGPRSKSTIGVNEPPTTALPFPI